MDSAHLIKNRHPCLMSDWLVSQDCNMLKMKKAQPVAGADTGSLKNMSHIYPLTSTYGKGKGKGEHAPPEIEKSVCSGWLFNWGGHKWMHGKHWYLLSAGTDSCPLWLLNRDERKLIFMNCLQQLWLINAKNVFGLKVTFSNEIRPKSDTKYSGGLRMHFMSQFPSKVSKGTLPPL